MHKKYKILLFDLDNTLVDDDKNREYAFKKVLTERNEVATKERIERFIDIDNQFWKNRAEGKIKDPYEFKSDEEKIKWLRAQRFIKYFKEISFEEATQINQNYISYLSSNIVPMNNSQIILKYLYEKRYEIYIATNGPKSAINDKLKKANVEQYINDAFSAEEAGHMKPHNVFYEKLFKKIGPYEKNDMLIIGDELDKDILGGIKNDIDSCWVNIKKIENHTKYKPNYEINDLIELKNFL